MILTLLPKITMDTRSILIFCFRNLKNPLKALRKKKVEATTLSPLHLIKTPKHLFLHQVSRYWKHRQSNLVFIRGFPDRAEYWKNQGNGEPVHHFSSFYMFNDVNLFYSFLLPLEYEILQLLL